MDICQPYREELILWNKTHNLVSKNEISNLDEHFADSLSLIPWIEESHENVIIDIGSGGGFPIIPLAFWAKDKKKEYRFIATDIIDKKLAFLKWCGAKFDLNLEIVKVDKRFIFDMPCLITSRAFGSVKEIIKWTTLHTPQAKRLLLLKGNTVQQELDQIKNTEYTLHPNPRGYIADILMLYHPSENSNNQIR